MMYHWLSFCDPELPKGQQFLGVAIVEAEDAVEAVYKAWQHDCNPGGEVLSCEIYIDSPTAIDMLQPYLYRLLDKGELHKMNNFIRSAPILNQ